MNVLLWPHKDYTDTTFWHLQLPAYFLLLLLTKNVWKFGGHCMYIRVAFQLSICNLVNVPISNLQPTVALDVYRQTWTIWITLFIMPIYKLKIQMCTCTWHTQLTMQKCQWALNVMVSSKFERVGHIIYICLQSDNHCYFFLKLKLVAKRYYDGWPFKILFIRCTVHQLIVWFLLYSYAALKKKINRNWEKMR